jgi:integrase
MPHLPFSISKRKGRRFLYVQFKSNGKYLPAISTRQTTEDAAIEVAFKWFREGLPRTNKNDNGKDGIGSNACPVNIPLLLNDMIRTVKSNDEAVYICDELKRLGYLKSFIICGSESSKELIMFLSNFWDYDSSPYIKEKLRKNHSIHRNYVTGQRLSVEKYWKPCFGNRLLGEITRQDIDSFTDKLDDMAGRKLSAGRKNIIIKAGTIPLRWAFSKEIIEKDVTRDITWFSGEQRERRLLTPELVHDVFSIEWSDARAKLANMVAAVTGLRVGEIQGLRIRDLGEECLYVRHSWNARDKLKPTKNNEVRTVEIPFPFVIKELIDLACRNPYGADKDNYVFWTRKQADKPIEARIFLEGLRDALVKTGMPRTSADEYEFHGWRNYFTSYMRDKINLKLLKSQTGHKTDAMIFKYSDHLLPGERELVRQAQMEAFGALVPGR